ncbi:MAG: hypothetical protein A2Z51_12165 [Deltaproteobacteria bacterium RBG_19FT_COMBO_52_11]|nr:MAG: hypothetical protein A2Z51_12165 [Deltaproteobacteria bacterium RBG_19FT_COMBO_52_11]
MSDKTVSLCLARIVGEKGTIRKDWGGRISIALVYPNHYRVGMSNLGFQVVYNLLNRRDDIVAERAFLPEEQEMSLHFRAGKGLISLESQSPLSKFDIIAFSLSFENDYPNILKILQMARIPLLAVERDETYPLIMAGGITSFLNPEPLAGVFDLFLLGEAEAALDGFIDLFKEERQRHNKRQRLLETLARDITHVYVPGLYRIEYRSDGRINARTTVKKDIPSKVVSARRMFIDLPVNRSCILTADTEFSDRMLIEIGRGCGRSCRFCAAGYVYRPPRTHDEKVIIECVNRSVDECRQFGLLSASVLDTPGIEDISAHILESGGSFSVASLRADLLTENMLMQLKRAGQKTIAIAPEAGSERLRRIINKHLTNNQITEAVRMIARVGEFSLRLYFLIGLPTETKKDVAEIVSLVKSIKHHMIKESRSRGKIGRIMLSVNCFIPKAFTPFQWFAMEEIEDLKEKQRWMKNALSKEGGVRISFDVPKWAYIQALLSMGDRRVGPIIMQAHRFEDDWSKAFRHSEINPDFFVHRPKELDEILPWDFIDHGIRKEYLVKEYMLSLKEEESKICHVGACDRCGVCRTK